MLVLCGRCRPLGGMQSCRASALFSRLPFKPSTKRACSCLSRRAVILHRASCHGLEKMTCHPRLTVPSLWHGDVDHPALGSTLFRPLGSPARVECVQTKGNRGGPRHVSADKMSIRVGWFHGSERLPRVMETRQLDAKRVDTGIACYKSQIMGPKQCVMDPPNLVPQSDAIPNESRHWVRHRRGGGQRSEPTSLDLSTARSRGENGQQPQCDLFIALDFRPSKFAPVGNTDQSSANRHGKLHFPRT